MPDSSRREIKLFYCYAREDKALRDELENHLSSLNHLYRLRNWHDREILPGQEWEQAIEDSLNTAHVVFLLVSPDFMRSHYAYGKEMKRALERHVEGTCKVLPILLRPTFYDGTPFTKLQMLPTDATPISRWSDRDMAFLDVVKQINVVLKDLLLSLTSKEDWLNEGITYCNQKRYEYALEAFEQALQRDANYLEAYQEKGKTLFELERYDYALEVFEHVLRLYPNAAPLIIAKGQTLNALKRYGNAFDTFEQAIRLDPTNVSAYIGRDKALQELGISREAQEKLVGQLTQTRQQLADSQKRTEELEGRLQQTSHDLTKHQRRLKELESQLTQVQVEKDEVLEQLDLSRKAQEELESQLAQTRQRLTEWQKRTEELEGQLEAQLAESRELLASQSQGRNLGLVVVTETNPGIKRKHKPNEDSLFAVQGARALNSQLQRFGLFVVADGMSGYANGQDASRTAIQHVIDFMLPRLATGDALNDEGYMSLLTDGVQQANLAVHQRNLQNHADMGTTMTAALVIGSTAYIGNVGDSRTYLYRKSEGLQQITHDHSVVASLVDAGIIKPNDIYTHPKRDQIYRSLGEKPDVEIDSFVQPLRSDDKLLLCSDGLWKMVRDPDIQQVVRSSIPNLNQVGKNLVQAALGRGGKENVSVIVVSITKQFYTNVPDVFVHTMPDSVTLPDLLDL